MDRRVSYYVNNDALRSYNVDDDVTSNYGNADKGQGNMMNRRDSDDY